MKQIAVITVFLLTSLTSLSQNWDGHKVIDSLRTMVIDKPEVVEKIVDRYIKESSINKDSVSHARLLDLKGIAKRNLGEYAAALENHKLSYDMYSRINNTHGMARALSSTGIIMIRTNKFTEAVDYFNQALKYCKPTDSSMLNSIYINLGVAYDYSDRQELAIETYRKALPYAITTSDDYGVGVVLHNIGVCYSMLKKYKEAEEYEFRALEYQKKSGNLDLLARIGSSLGVVYLDQNKMDKALYYFDLGGRAAEQIESVELREEYLTNLIEFYIIKRDTDKALDAFAKLNKLKEDVYNSENSKNTAEAEAKFNVTLKNKEIENLKISKRIAELSAERSTLLRNVLLGGIILILVILIAVYRNYQLRKRNLILVENEKKALERNNEYLQNENMLARFEILKSQVSPHFLFNTLNALSYLIESDSEKAIQFTAAFSKLYRTILELKDKNLITLEEELSHVESYFFLQTTRFGNNLRISKDIPEENYGLMLPPFSIQLAVENAINHNVISESRPLFIKIYCFEKYLVIENNLREKLKTIKSTSIGIANIKSRYSFFTETNPEFIKTEESFIVKLPLLKQEVNELAN